MIEILNAKDLPKLKAGNIYIGREMPGFERSPLANPHRLKDGGTRTEVIARFKEDLRNDWRQNGPMSHELMRIGAIYAEKGELRLVCWCAPKPCHGDVIKEVILKLFYAGRILTNLCFAAFQQVELYYQLYAKQQIKIINLPYWKIAVQTAMKKCTTFLQKKYFRARQK